MKNTYTNLKLKTPPKIKKLLALWPTKGLFIGIGGFWKTRRGHASKIDAWPHHRTADLRPNQGVSSLVLVRGCVVALGASWYIPILVISPEYSSNVRKSLGSMYLLEDPLLGLQELRI